MELALTQRNGKMTNERKLLLIGDALHAQASLINTLEKLGRYEASNTQTICACVDAIGMLDSLRRNILEDEH